MARAGINKALVQRARDALLARGLAPSIEAVRAELGHTGSKTTISRYLQELAAAEPRPPVISLSSELHALIESLAQRLAGEAQEAVAADRARLERQQAAYQQQRAVDAARWEELQKTHLALGEEYRQLSLREVSLNERLHGIEGERQRLKEACRQQSQLLEERLGQIQSLESKHQQVRDALAHYRQQHLAQRQEELQRHDQQLIQVQAETRGLREQLAARHEELTQLYRELERSNSSMSHQQQQLRQLERELVGVQHQLTSRETALAIARQAVDEMSNELAAMREKAKHYLMAHRQDQRLVRAQAKQLGYLQGLIPATNANHSPS